MNIETFLPFDLEFTFSAALHLTIACTLFQFENTEQHHTETAHRIFEHLVSGGNRVAEVRKTELIHIQFLFQEFSNRIEPQGVQSLDLFGRIEDQASPGRGFDCEEQSEFLGESSMALEWPTTPEENMGSASLTRELLAPGQYSLEAIGISSNEFLNIVDQISTQDLTHGMWGPQPEWLVGGNPVSDDNLVCDLHTS